MKLLALEDYLKSPNQLAGLSEEREAAMIQECMSFIESMITHFRVHPEVQGVAMSIFHLYCKRVSFTEVDRTLLACVCFFIAGKASYYHC
jgi:hypothetical protein